jgi:hypothetical protein
LNICKVLLVLEIRRCQHINVIFCQLNISHVRVQRAEGDIWGRRGWLKGLLGKGQLILSMGLGWREVRILAHGSHTK